MTHVQQRRANAPSQSQGSHTQGSRGPGPRAIPGMGGHLLQQKERGAIDGKTPEDVKGEFNFETGLDGFDKEEEFSKLMVSEEGSQGVSNIAYSSITYLLIVCLGL